MTVEIMISLSLFILFTISAHALNSSSQGIKTWSLKELDLMKRSAQIMDNAISNSSTTNISYGNNSTIIISEPFRVVNLTL